MNLENIYHKLKPYVPSRVLYSNSYFEALALLRKYGGGQVPASIQDDLLKKQLIYCLKYVEFYKDQVDLNISKAKGMSGADILGEFPYITKKMVNENKDLFVSSTCKPNKLLSATSGGSTGVGIQVQRNKSVSDAEKAFFDYEWGKLGFNFKTSKILRFGSDALKQVDELPCEKVGRKLACSPYHFNDRWLPVIAVEAEKHQPDFLHGYPSLVYCYLTYLKSNNINLPKTLVGCLLASEHVMPHQLTIFQEYFGKNISINYGLTERTIIAFSDFSTNNELVYRVNNLYGYAENVKLDDGSLELVGTSYWNQVMPLVRYRTNDLGEIKDGAISKLDGRAQELLVTKSGSRLPGMTVSIDKFMWSVFSDIQLLQKTPGQVIFNLVPRDPKNIDYSAIEKFKSSQIQKWGCYFDMTYEIVDMVKISKSGKKRLVVCE